MATPFDFYARDSVHERLCDPELERFFAAQENEAAQSRLPLTVLHANGNLNEGVGGGASTLLGLGSRPASTMLGARPSSAKGPEARASARLARGLGRRGKAEKGGGNKEKATAQKTNAKGWVTWRENGRIVFAERQGAEGGGNEAEGGSESDESEACEITAVTHVSDPVASFDLCEEQDQEDKEKYITELLKSTKETLEWLRKIEPDHEKLLASLQITEPGSLPRLRFTT